LYLSKRSGIYYLRIRIPVDVIQLIGRTEIKLSLRTAGYRDAKSRGKLKVATLESIFHKIRMWQEIMPEKQIKRITDKLLADFLNRVEEPRQYGKTAFDVIPKLPEGIDFDVVVDTLEPVGSMVAVKAFHEGRIAQLRKELAGSSFSEETRYLAKHKIEEHSANKIAVPPKSWFLPPHHEIEAGYDSTWHEKPAAEFYRLCREIVQARIFGHEIELERLDGIYSSVKQIHAEGRIATPYYTLNDIWGVFKKGKEVSGKVGELTLDRYLNHVKALNRVLGEDYNFAEFEEVDNVHRLMELLKQYKSVKGNKPWSATNVNNCLTALSVFYKQMKKDKKFGIISNPFDTKQISGSRKRRPPLDGDERQKVRSGLDALPHKKCTDRWTMEIMLYTGCRIGEVCQLRVADIKQDGSVWYFHFRDDPETRQKLKQSRAKRDKYDEVVERFTPVHNDLIQRGFLKYVAEMKRGGYVQLFPAEKPDKKGRWGQLTTKRVKSFLRRQLGRDTDKSSHTFRRTFINQFKQCGLIKTFDDNLIFKAMVGHDIQKGEDITWDVYAAGYQPKTMNKLLQRLNYDLATD